MTTTCTPAQFARPTPSQVVRAILAMATVVLASNMLVQFAINDWLTWGAFTYPVAYLVSDLVNRRFGPGMARRVAWIGFAVALVASFAAAPARIALASGRPSSPRNCSTSACSTACAAASGGARR
jgi:uncharacterized PurR-regulated membrane protein YhhQ (DUF165 family)